MDEAVAFRYFKIKSLSSEIVWRLRSEAMKLGFERSEIEISDPFDAHYRLEKDPSNCEYSLIGEQVHQEADGRGVQGHGQGQEFCVVRLAVQEPVLDQVRPPAEEIGQCQGFGLFRQRSALQGQSLI